MLDGVTYRGVFTTQWDDDNGAWVYAFSAISADGVAVWGSQTVVATSAAHGSRCAARAPRYGQTFSLAMPRPHGNPRDAYSYSVVSGPPGLTVDRATGVVTWRPALSDVGIPYEVTVRALKTEAGDPDQTWYTFTPHRVVGHGRPAPGPALLGGGVRRAARRERPVHRAHDAAFPARAAALPELDPNLRLDPAAGVLALSTTRADFNGAAGLDDEQQPGRGARPTSGSREARTSR